MVDSSIQLPANELRATERKSLQDWESKVASVLKGLCLVSPRMNCGRDRNEANHLDRIDNQQPNSILFAIAAWSCL
jgi:hypothetical protein